MKVKVIDEKCISCGLCASIAPEVFRLPDDDTAKVVSQPTPDQEDAAHEAVEGCPTEAIEEE